jgi:MFS family permease
MESAADATVAFVKAGAGRASDRARRRKPFVLFGYAASALARPLLALATLPAQVVALRIWDRFAKGVRSAPRDALVAEAVEPGARAAAFATQRGLDHLGAALGPLVAAALLAAGAGTRSVFLAATLPALLGVATIVGLKEERRPEPETAAAGQRGRIGALFFGAAAAFGLANASDAFLLLYAAQLGAPAPALPLLWSGLHLVRWAAAARGGRLADALGARRALAFGWALYAAVYASFGFAASLAPFALALAAYGALAGLVEGAERAVAVGLLGIERAGAALGAWQRASGLGALGASLLFGALWEVASARAAFLGAAGAAALAVVALVLARRRERSAQR